MAPVFCHAGRFPPDERLDWGRLIPFIGPASGAVARYDGMLAAVPNPDILIAPLTTQEAVLSSRIEGTVATMGDVLEFEAGQEPESPVRRDDIQEVLNYRAALRRAEELLTELPLSLRVVRQAHEVLLRGVRGEGKAPGELRRTPNCSYGNVVSSVRPGSTSAPTLRPVETPTTTACSLSREMTTGPVGAGSFWRRCGRRRRTI